MNNYKIIIQYDGTDFAGWQIQQNAITVQQIITEKIGMITGEQINLIGSGRTDAGVHSLGQTANFKINSDIDDYKFLRSINGVLPDTISVKSIEAVDDEFHSRFDAKKRSYLYLINKSKNPFLKKYSYFFRFANKIDFNKLNKNAKVFIGEKDFTSFAKKKTEVQNKVCIINDIAFRESGDIVYFFIEANRFLHGMVRAVLGTLLDTVDEFNQQEKIEEIIDMHDRNQAGRGVPSTGLFLYKVKY